VSVVGEDFPADVIADMNQRGINTDGLQIKAGEKSFFWSGKYHHDMNSRDTLITDLNVLADFDPVLPDSYAQPDFLMLGNIDPNLQIKVLDQLEKRPKLVLLDTMNFWMTDPWKDALVDVIQRIDVLAINDEEARLLSGEYSLVTAAKKILAMGPDYLIIKKGEHGALLFGDDQVFFAPALPLEVVFDPTGAGDSFAGGIMGFLANHGEPNFEKLKSAIIVGSAMASFCVEKFGPERLLELDQDMIRNRVNQFIELVRFEPA